jgi:diaminopimelate epimerase
MNKFAKYHALGNDYIVLDPLFFRHDLTEKAIRLICHRNLGIGGDGILYGPLVNSNKEHCFKIFNPDGSEAEKSGNGLAIFSLYALDNNYVQSPKFSLKTKGGKVIVRVKSRKDNIFQIELGHFSFNSNDIPCLLNKDTSLNLTVEVLGQKEVVNCVNIGNPHCVIIKDQASREIAETLGPILEKSHYFPNGINVQIVEILDQNNIKIEIWERGAGYTLASGTSSAAASCVAHKLGLVNSDVMVHMQGGSAQIRIDDHCVHLTTRASRITTGTFSSDFIDVMLNGNVSTLL